MGGSLAALYIVIANRQQQQQPHAATEVAEVEGHLKVLEALILKAAPMHEKLLEETRKDKPEKVHLLGNAKERPRDKPLKQSKLAERLRRSFRRREHSSLEIKRCESQSDEFHTKHLGTPALATTDNINLSQVSQQHFSLSFGGGHINTALLLDSPDECTPPEYAYQHLSSVATTNTNSSSSLESSYELSELRDSQTSIYYWACPKNPEMGSEMSTAVTSTNITELPANLRRRAEGAQLQNRSEPPPTAAANSSRSCSLTSDSSSARITRLQNFLFKNSNESSRSCLGHSNDGFTASSYNSSSGEWEQLGAHPAGGIHDLNTGSFPEECTPYDDNDVDATLPNESSDAGPYYQYTLTSPNNPFLPEITARSYHSTYKNEEHQEGALPQEELQLDCNVTSVKYTGSGTATRCAQLPTPGYSRAGSQESSYSESIISGPPGPTPSPASSSSSTPGRHRRKLFSLNSPTRLQQQQSNTSATSYQQQQLQKIEISSSPTDVNQGTPLIRTLNPFLATATSPIAMPSTDLRSKREEFLRATMKICLVVSPPASKLQLKSKSLTNLDGLNTEASCHPGTAAPELPVRTLISPKSSVPVDLLHQQSAEFFTVSFQSETGQCTDEIYLPVIKGVTLQNALRQELQRRNVNFSQITVTDNNAAHSNLDPAGASGLANALDEYTEVESLAGHHLVVTERDGSRKTLQKAASFGSRQRPPRLLSSASTEETSELATAPSKQIRQRWSSIFGVKNPQQSQLYELLNCYAKNGVPQRAGSLGFDHPTLSDSLKYLQNMDKTWRDFVESKAMSDNEVKIQTAIWELVTTEVDYIHALQTVTDLFLACLEAVQEERLLIEVDQHRLFSNIRSVCEANIKFWTLWLFPMVAHSARTHEPLQCAFFNEGFIRFASTFAPYKFYCAEQSTCQFYCKELNQNNSLFTAYLAWCESQKMCNRLRLADIVVRPMQRLTKYSLLLTAIRKHMDDIEQIEAMDKMIHSVENFVGSVNNHLTMRQESERLKGVMARIESYDVVDTNNEGLEKLIKQHSQMFDLCGPMPGCGAYQVRHLFMEGDHKFKDNVSKSDVHCFLLTDILLVCKSIAKKGLGALKVIRQPYLTDHLVVHLGHNNTLNCVYLNEFQVATTAFTLQCTEAKNWYDALWRAKTIYQRLKRGISANYGDSFRFGGSATSGATVDSLGVRKSPINSSIGSHVSSANNSHSGSVEWNDSRNISVDFDKTNSMSSDEGFSHMGGNQAQPAKGKPHLQAGIVKPKSGAIASTTGNTLSVQPLNHLGQSLPNLSMQHIQTNNTLLVPGTTTSHSGNMLLSPSHRGISYPPPSPTRVPLRRGMAFSTSTKNPPLLKTRNITSQNSINWHQIPSTPTPPSPRSQQLSPGHIHKGSLQHGMTENQLPLPQKQISHKKPLATAASTAKEGILSLQRRLSTETDV